MKNSLAKSFTWFLLCSLAASCSESACTETAGAQQSTLCDILSKQGELAGKEVKFDAWAEAGSHTFEIALSDSSCPHQYIFLSVPSAFKNDEQFRSVLKKIYPGYPDDDGYKKIKVNVSVSGTFELRDYRGVSSRFLELRQIEEH